MHRFIDRPAAYVAGAVTTVASGPILSAINLVQTQALTYIATGCGFAFLFWIKDYGRKQEAKAIREEQYAREDREEAKENKRLENELIFQNTLVNQLHLRINILEREREDFAHFDDSLKKKLESSEHRVIKEVEVVGAKIDKAACESVDRDKIQIDQCVEFAHESVVRDDAQMKQSKSGSGIVKSPIILP